MNLQNLIIQLNENFTNKNFANVTPEEEQEVMDSDNTLEFDVGFIKGYEECIKLITSIYNERKT